MKKIVCFALALVFVLALGSCAADIHKKSEGVLTHAQYLGTEDSKEVVVETFVQDKQSWWDNKATVYTQDKDGAYFLYNMSISEDDYKKLVPGQKIRVKGTKSTWSGEVEIVDATCEILTGNYIAPAFDATALLGKNDELAKHMNEFVTFKGVKIEAKGEEGLPFFYGWDNSGKDQQDADLYFDISYNGNKYTFLVEYYLRNADTDTYKAVKDLKVGDTVDLEGFMYWYEGPQAHITGVKKVG
ncbi:MAG: hypothetical protein II715_01160 [Clostridia bacterium]|nr:hypothetical protein [Clostridia bacterium]